MKPYVRLLACAAAGAASASLTAQRPPIGDRLPLRGTPGISKAIIAFQGMTRAYLLHVPPDPDGALVLAFHGGQEDATNQQQISGLDRLADREHFIVAYPEGIGKSWADGRGTTNADRQGVDDVGFAKAVVADIATAYQVDRERVYATGPSNGGIFANRLGCEAADTFAAIAPVIGTIATKLAASCRPSAPVAVVGIVGVADPIVPFKGGEVGITLNGASAGGFVESSRDTQALWASLNRCDTSFSVTTLLSRVQDGTSVTRHAYGRCRANADVVWYEIEGGGHRWPPHQAQGMAQRVANRTLGVSSQNINASEIIWAFFAAHRRSGT